MITVAGVSQRFAARRRQPGVHALDQISLEIQPNEFVALVGRSGCGKSTLLRIVAGLFPATEGRVEIDGEEVREPRRDVSLMFQRPALLPWRSVLENILLPVEIHRLSKREYRERAHALLQVVGLDGFAERRPWELSGGMQQRVALCRALIVNPRILLMDEPFAALDALTREELSLELQRIWTDYRTTILFVTHSIEEAVLLADRVVVMTPRPGRVLEEVPVALPRPRSLGASGKSDELHRCSAHVHDLLFRREAEVR